MLTPVHVPEGLDDAPRIMFFSLDVIMIAVTVFVLCAEVNQMLAGAILAVVLGFLYERYIKRFCVLWRVFYWTFGLWPFVFDRIPKSARRYFLG